MGPIGSWIVTILEAYAPLLALVPASRIGPDDTVTPPAAEVVYITVEHAGGTGDVYVLGADHQRIKGEHVYQITSRARTGTWQNVGAAHEQVRAALHNTSGVYAGVFISRALCESEDQLPELVEGVRYRNRWWLCRVEGQSS